MAITVQESLARLREVARSGELAAMCGRFYLELVVVFGSSIDPQPGVEPRDVDVAVGFVPGAERDFLGVVNALIALVPGGELDVMDLDRADPVAQKAAMFGSEVLFETHPSVTTERQIKAFMAYEDTRRLRALQLEFLQS